MASFLFGAFGITWFAELILIFFDKIGILGGNTVLFAMIMTVAVFGPGLGAYFAWKKDKSITGFKSFVKKEIGNKKWKITCGTVLATMAVMLLINFLFLDRTSEKWYMFFLYIPYMIFGGGFEELGWRGYLHPYFKKKYDFPVAVILVGIIWAIWHLPLWLVTGTSQSTEDFGCFVLFCLCLAFILAIIYEITQNVIACILIHAWSNVLFAMFYYHLDSWNIRTAIPFMVMAIMAGIAYAIWKSKNKDDNEPIEFLTKEDAISVLKPNGTAVDYFLFDEYEIHLNKINAHTVQEWHYHTKIEETLLVTSGILGCKWVEKDEKGDEVEKTKYLQQGDIILVGNSIHTFFNNTDEVTKFTVFRFVPTKENKRELIKNDKIIVNRI